MVRIIVDSRETQLISLLQSRDLDKYVNLISIETHQLDIGDIQITCDNKVWTLERKTVQDLMASVKDGRYKEQKMRLQSSGHDCTYVIEGDDVLSHKFERYQSILSGAYLHTMYRDNMRIIFTKNINDTCTFILTLACKIVDKPDAFLQEKANQDQDEYIDCLKLKTKKIENITPENCYLMQLSQIPTISITIAKNIQKMYPTMRDFVKMLDEAEDKVGLLLKIDKIGKEKANKILQFMSLQI
jgi:crossover junction endonuclease MUS81